MANGYNPPHRSDVDSGLHGDVTLLRHSGSDPATAALIRKGDVKTLAARLGLTEARARAALAAIR